MNRLKERRLELGLPSGIMSGSTATASPMQTHRPEAVSTLPSFWFMWA